jgi:ABC-2 type transport system permease protein
MTLCYSIILQLGLALLFDFIYKDTGTNTALLVMFSSFVPIGACFSYAGNYANEIETGAVLRFKQFGYSEKTLLISKLLVYLILITISFAVYFSVLFISIPLLAPTAISLVVLIIFLYVFSALLFVFIHSIATLCGNFSVTYGITFITLCVLMGLSGLWGTFDGVPFINALSHAIPTFYINTEFITYWLGGSFDFLPLALSLGGFAVVCVALHYLGIYANKKKRNGKRKQTALTIFFKILLPIPSKNTDD